MQTAIFHNAVGFTTEDEMDLALLSGLIRRLKCCSEAVATRRLKTGTEDDDSSISDHGNPDHYPEAEISERGIALLDGVVSVASDGRHAISTTFHHDFVRLLDELDQVGDRLTRDLRARKDFVDLGWPGVYLVFESHSVVHGPMAFLGLAIQNGLTFYVETKMRNGMVPRDQLIHLLSEAAWLNWRTWRGGNLYHPTFPSIELIENLLQEGADPNQQVTESSLATGLRRSWTPWTGFLENNFYSGLTSPHSHCMVEDLIAMAHLFLKYGADPAARWDCEFGHGPDIFHEVVTPEIIISRLLDSEPRFRPTSRESRFRKDLEELLGILGLTGKETVIE